MAPAAAGREFLSLTCKVASKWEPKRVSSSWIFDIFAFGTRCLYAKTAKKGGFGQNWVNGLYYVKFNFQHDRSNVRAHFKTFNQIEISPGNLVKMPTKMLKISVLWPQWALKLLLSCWKLNFT